MNPWWEDYDQLQNYLLGQVPGTFKYGIGSSFDQNRQQWGAGPQWMRNNKNIDQVPGRDYVYYPLKGQMPPYSSAPIDRGPELTADSQDFAQPSAGGVPTIPIGQQPQKRDGWSYKGWGIVGSQQNPLRGVGNPFGGG